MVDIIHADFESRGTVELRGQKSAGVYNYVRHKDTLPLMLGWALNNEKPQPWRIYEGEPVPKILDEALRDPSVLITAFNSTFERYIFNFKLGYDIPISRFIDPQASARYLSLPGSLEEVSTILGLPESMAKDRRGEQLIQLFSKPHKKKKKRGEAVEWEFYDHTTHPKEWEEFVAYCLQDVVAEREILRREKLLGAYPLPPLEQKIWLLDQKINDRGIAVDVEFVTKALKLAEREKQEVIESQNKLTGLENANSNSQMSDWIKTQGFEGNSLRKGAVDAALKYNENLTPLGRQVLEARKAASSTSYKKLAAILRQVCDDGRIRNQFIYYGSPRCGRFSGSTVQIHNLARPLVLNNHNFEDESVMEEARGLVFKEDYDGLKQKYGSVLLAIKSLIRTAFIAGNL